MHTKRQLNKQENQESTHTKAKQLNKKENVWEQTRERRGGTAAKQQISQKTVHGAKQISKKTKEKRPHGCQANLHTQYEGNRHYCNKIFNGGLRDEQLISTTRYVQLEIWFSNKEIKEVAHAQRLQN